jgi:hypothetical protein
MSGTLRSSRRATWRVILVLVAVFASAALLAGCAHRADTSSTVSSAAAITSQAAGASDPSSTTARARPSTTSTARPSTTTTQAPTTTTTLSPEEIIARRNASYRPLKGLYLTGYSAGNPTSLARLVKIADDTEINAFVIDVKDSSGYVLYDSSASFAKKEGLIKREIKNIDGLVATLKQHNITPIARIVCFQDSPLAKKMPSLAVKSKRTGGNWQDNKKAMYTNPYNHTVWEYLVEVAEDAAKHGFTEIQFDYVRFPSDGPIADASYPGANAPKEDAIAAFLAFAHSRLEKLGVWMSADVFGLTVQEKGDGGIGQKIEKIAANVDIVCPMIYPSHYAKGVYGLADPNAHPYELISSACKDISTRLAGTGAKGRPWLQDFSLGSPPYGVAEVKAEIKAAKDQGFNEWILWNAGNTYTVAALAPE